MLALQRSQFFWLSRMNQLVKLADIFMEWFSEFATIFWIWFLLNSQCYINVTLTRKQCVIRQTCVFKSETFTPSFWAICSIRPDRDRRLAEGERPPILPRAERRLDWSLNWSQNETERRGLLESFRSVELRLRFKIDGDCFRLDP